MTSKQQQQQRTVRSTGTSHHPSGMYLHASAVMLDGGAILFLGHSTAGKSTMARLLSPICPILADDTVLVQRNDSGQWLVTDGKIRFSASTTTKARPRHLTIPLHACIRIHKGPTLTCEPLPPLALAQCLMDAVMEVDVQRKCGRLGPKNAAAAPAAIAAARAMRGHWFHLAAEIARICPGRHLWFPHNAVSDALVTAIDWRFPRNGPPGSFPFGKTVLPGRAVS